MTAEKVPGGFRVRLRFGRDKATGKAQRDRFLMVLPHTPEGEIHAADRERRMQVTAAALAKLQSASAREHLIEMGKLAADERAFRALERAVEKLAAEAASGAPAVAPSGPVTFRQIAEDWGSGKLTRDYPDHKLLPNKTDKGRADDLTIARVFYPAIGSKLMSEITLADIDAARRLIPTDLHPNTRRLYVVKLRLLFRIAVSPLRLLPVAPEIDIPRRVPSNLFGYLYPQEEALLLGCIRIPLVYRVLYGYLARNGCRIGETLQLTWDHVDLETGDIHIDKRWTKTKRARRWVLDTDVVQALEAYFIECKRPAGSARVFPGQQRGPLSGSTVKKRFIDDLRKAGVTRSSILDGADGIEPIRVHDLRASFVTLSLRAGKPLKWIMTRTGHESLTVMKGYDRLVQDAEEHHLPAWFSDMARGIPEFSRHLKGGPSLGQHPKNPEQKATYSHSAWTPEPSQSEQKPAEKAPSVTTETPLPPTSGPAEIQGVGQAGPAGGPASGGTDTATPEESVAVILARIEESLASDLKVAIAAGRYELAERLLAELGERRRARTAPTVPSLSDARAKREKGEGK
jgi:integrase